MQAMSGNGCLLAVFSLGGGELILILALVFILFGAKRLPEMGQGLRRGFFQFLKASRELGTGIDDAASEAGRSLGGIYGKPAAQALTPDNQIAELYEPRVFESKENSRNRWSRITEFLKAVKVTLCRFLRWLVE